MRIGITGASGQLGAELTHLLQSEEVIAWRHGDLAIEDHKAVQAVLEKEQPGIVINCAAYNQVDLAEEEPERAYAVNALGPRNLALQAEQMQIPLVHVSTNYVFGTDVNRETPYTELDGPGPQGAYAISKLAGEHFALNCCSRSFVLRTTGLYGNAGEGGKSNFVENMLRLSEQHQSLRIVNDQISAPTPTSELARGIVKLIQTDAYGLYHATSAGATSWFEFATEIFRLAGKSVEITPVTTKEYGAPAPRPLYSVLNCEKLETVIDDSFPDWKTSLAEYMQTR